MFFIPKIHNSQQPINKSLTFLSPNFQNQFDFSPVRNHCNKAVFIILYYASIECRGGPVCPPGALPFFAASGRAGVGAGLQKGRYEGSYKRSYGKQYYESLNKQKRMVCLVAASHKEAKVGGQGRSVPGATLTLKTAKNL